MSPRSAGFAEETHAVRRAVLRPGRPAEETIYPGDEHAATIHLGAFLGTPLTGVATLMREPCQGQDRDWRLRAIAVVDEERGRGVGGACWRGSSQKPYVPEDACSGVMAARGHGPSTSGTAFRPGARSSSHP